MFNVVVKKYGNPDSLVFEETESQKINDDEVRINVESAGVNFADLLIIKGRYQERPRPPFFSWLRSSRYNYGSRKNVSNFKAGDKVMSIMKYGGYKTEIVVPKENTYHVPNQMNIIEAGGFLLYMELPIAR